MRTTITIKDDLVRRLQDEMRARGTSFRQTLESVLARGLENRPVNSKGKPFRVQARPMVLKAGIDPARLQDVETDCEIEHFQSILRQRKKDS